MEDFKVVVFRIAEEEYAIHIQDVVSIEKLQALTAIPKAPEYIAGMVNIRGTVTPVVDLRVALGQSRMLVSESSRIILIQMDDHPVGLIVDAATDVIDIPVDTIQKPNLIGTQMPSSLQGVSKLASRLLILLDIQSLLRDIDAFKSLKDLNIEVA